VADFGCGTGVLSVSIARWAKSVVAIDQNKDALTEAKSRAKREGVRNITFLREDLHHLSLPAGGTGLVVVSQSLHHVDDPQAVILEAARILAPRGRVVVLELMPHRETWVHERLGHKHLGFQPADLERQLKRAGFERVNREVHPQNASSPFRVFLLTGEKR